MMKALIAEWAPPGIRRIANQLLGALTAYKGPYPNWSYARAYTRGYGQDDILQRVFDATKKVLRGEAHYEQDGIAMLGTPPASHALTGLLLAPSLDHGRLSALDFGGGLASHFLRWRPTLSALPSLHWTVVEQEPFVVVGRQLFENERALSFHTSISQLTVPPNAALVSGVLQYLEDPHAILQELIATDCTVVILDRTPYSNDGTERIAAQFVPQRLGKASYPVWMLSRDRVHAALSQRYTLVQEFNSDDEPMRVGGHVATYRGSIWVRNQ